MTEPLLAEPGVQQAIELVWHEAKLLDDKDYPAWQALYTDDAYYVIPIDRETKDFASCLNIVYDDARMRSMRVERMIQGYSPSAVAAASTVRTLGRFTLEAVQDDVVVLKSVQILCAYKRQELETFAAEVEHHVVLGDTPRIRLKVIRLLNSDDPVPGAGFLL
ncbi:MAG: aromatic-ring-hydroxylating dioxygenase subunit beta [Actinomycetales bacterium]